MKSLFVLRLLDAGQATVLNAKPPFQANLIQKVTHVFVEKAMEKDIQCFLAAGIPCLSPDYIPEYILQVNYWCIQLKQMRPHITMFICIIKHTEKVIIYFKIYFFLLIQDPIPTLDDFSIFNFSNPKPIQKTVTREPTNRYITPVYPPGECGAPKTKSRISDIKMKNKGQKRQAEAILIEDHPSPPKKLKQVNFPRVLFSKLLYLLLLGSDLVILPPADQGKGLK